MDEKVSTLSSITSEVVSIQENINQFKESRKQFDESVKAVTVSTAKDASQQKTASLARTDINPTDTSKAE